LHSDNIDEFKRSFNIQKEKNSMKIGYDIQALYSGSKNGGIGRYCQRLLSKIFEMYPNNDYLLFTNSLHKHVEPFPSKNNVTYHNIRYLSDHGRNPINFLIQYANYYAKDLDIIHILSPLEFTFESVISPNFLSNKTVLTLYDLIPLKYASLYLSSESTRLEYLSNIKMYQNTDLIVSISEWSLKDAHDLLDIPYEKMTNAGIAVDDQFHQLRSLNSSDTERTRQKYGLDGKFILYVGSIDIRKNIVGLIDAFALLPDILKKKYQLVIACNYTETATLNLEGYARKTCGNKVKFLHFITDEELNILYNICNLFVLPSLYEGGGLPILEAMKCGAPVIAGNNSSIPEIVGRTDNLFIAESPFSMCKMMTKALTDHEYNQELREYGLSRVKIYNWENVARTVMKSYELLLENNQIKSSRNKKLNNLAKIDLGLVTTWNTKCGIANYSKYLVNHIPEGKIGFYRIFARKDKIVVSNDQENVTRCWANHEDVENMIVEILECEPKIVDIMFNYAFFTPDQLATLIIRLKQNNIKVVITIHDTIQYEPTHKALKDIVTELNIVDTIIVFNTDQLVQLRQYGVSTIIQNMPQGILQYADEDRFDLRKKLNISNKEIIASTGFLLPHKGILEVIKSLPNLLNTHPDILYLVVCSLHIDPSSEQYLRLCEVTVDQLSLKNHVRFINDYLDEKDVMKYLHLSDIIVLPYKYSDQPTSAGLRFALSALRPVITTDSPIFKSFQAETYKIVDSNPKNISDAINILYKDSSIYNDILSATKQRVKEESWETVAKKYTSILLRCNNNNPDNSVKWLKLIDELSQQIKGIYNINQNTAIDVISKEIIRLEESESTISFLKNL
jgi:glycosyltransferase involved in cell wall biosynthesis